MFFLWVFGLIVEGKLGWRKFLPVFLGLGMLESALEQLCLQNVHGSSLGASAAIVGLMAIALVWAPRNEIVFAYGLLFSVLTVGTVEISVLSLLLLLTASEVLAIWWLDVEASAAVLHLLGGLLGLGLGVTLLKQGVVDCEGWDLLSLWAGGQGASVEMGSPSAKPTRRHKTVRRVRELVHQGKPGAALREWRSLRHFLPESRLGRQDLHRMARALFRVGMWEEAVTLTEEYVSRFDEQTDELRVRAAIALLHKLERPHAVLRMIDPVDLYALPEPIRIRCRRLVSAARSLVESGVMELSSLAAPPSDVAPRAGVGVEASSSL